MSRHAFLLGGTGQIGQAVASNLLAAGWDVTIASRGLRPLPNGLAAKGAKCVTVNRDNPQDLDRALADGADALIDVIAYGPNEGRQLVAVQRKVGALVVVSSASVYRDQARRTLDEAAQNGFPELPDPITESQPTVEPGDATYSTRKVALEQLLLDKAKTPVTILRPCAIHGPGSLHPREWWFVKRILDDRPAIPLAYKGQSRFHTTSVLNIAELTRLALERPGTRVLNIGDPEALSVAEIGTAIARHMAYTGNIVEVATEAFPATVGRTPWSVPRPFVLDNSAALALGYRSATSYAEAIGSVCDDLARYRPDEDWRTHFPILASYPYDLFDYATERAFLSNWRHESR